MKLKEFVKTFILPNSLIRLLVEKEHGFEPLISSKHDTMCMEWEMLHKDFTDYEVVGIKDVWFVDGHSSAICIVVKE